jgi:rhamnogalacturonan endolyase
MLRMNVVLAAAVLLALRAPAIAQEAPPKPLVFEAEDCTTPKDAWEANKSSANKWNLWSTDADAAKKWSGGVVLQSPKVEADRATPEDGAPPLHTHLTGIPPGRYQVEIKLGRALGVSRDGKTWTRQEEPYLGVFEIADGTFDLWVDDRYVHAANPGSAYYDCLILTPVPPRVEKPKVQGCAQVRVREKLDRGLVALPRGGAKVYLCWRLLASDPVGVAFNVYRAGGDGDAPRKLNPEPLRTTTDFLDEAAPAPAACTYTIRAVTDAGEGAPSPGVTAQAADKPQDCLVLKFDEGATVQKVGIGDLDGDGRYDFVLKMPEANIDPYEKYWSRSPDTFQIEARTHDGRKLWRKDLGWAIERGMWYSPMVVQDLDGDGKAEVILKTGEGDPRDADGRVTKGPEWLSVLDGLTGQERARAPWPARELCDERYNYFSRNQLGIAFLDGKTPCIVVERGTYTTIAVQAWQFHENKLTKLWEWTSREEAGPKRYAGQGAHTLQAHDVDGDGRDEVVLGSAVIDDHGAGLWSTGLGHPDHCYVGEIDPGHPGLEIFYGMETAQREANGLCVVDAKTGRILWGLKGPTRHVHGYGFCADIDPGHPGAEVYGCDTDAEKKFNRGWLCSARGEVLEETKDYTSARPVYWDGDACRELILKGKITRYKGDKYPTQLVGRVVLIADVIGDWREEIITSAPGELRIYATALPATDRRVCLMQDPVYRNTITAAAQGYFYNSMLSYLPGVNGR